MTNTVEIKSQSRQKILLAHYAPFGLYPVSRRRGCAGGLCITKALWSSGDPIHAEKERYRPKGHQMYLGLRVLVVRGLDHVRTTGAVTHSVLEDRVRHSYAILRTGVTGSGVRSSSPE